jgi:protein phosphatase
MNCYGITDTGKKRPENQDRFSIFLPEHDSPCCLISVCDGMGGANGGAVAAETAIAIYNESVAEMLCDCDGDGAVMSVLSRAAEKANSAVFAAASENEELSGMGTTIVSFFRFENSGASFLLNVGDSRAYLVSEGEIKQISRDHSYVQHLIDTGELSPAKAANHPQKNIITRAIGIDSEVIPEVKKIDTAGYTYLLLCSDGLHGEVKDQEIKKIIFDPSAENVREKAEALVALANKKGGNDNITVVLLRLSDDQ